MTDIEMVEKSRIKEAISELQGESDIHVPVFAASAISGGAGLLMINQGEVKNDSRLTNTGFALTGAATGLSLAEVAAMAHHMLIEERQGDRAFMFHHDAAGIVAIALGALAFELEDIPDEFATFLIGLGLGVLAHHIITELTLEFVTPTEETLEQEAEKVEEVE